MPVTSAIAVYILIWSLVLFAVLPWRVRTAEEAGTERIAGQADSAPANPQLLWKLKWTTIIASAIFAAFYANYAFEWLTVADLPWLRRPGPR